MSHKSTIKVNTSFFYYFSVFLRKKIYKLGRILIVIANCNLETTKWLCEMSEN